MHIMYGHDCRCFIGMGCGAPIYGAALAYGPIGSFLFLTRHFSSLLSMVFRTKHIAALFVALLYCVSHKPHRRSEENWTLPTLENCLVYAVPICVTMARPLRKSSPVDGLFQSFLAPVGPMAISPVRIFMLSKPTITKADSARGFRVPRAIDCYQSPDLPELRTPSPLHVGASPRRQGFSAEWQGYARAFVGKVPRAVGSTRLHVRAAYQPRLKRFGGEQADQGGASQESQPSQWHIQCVWDGLIRCCQRSSVRFGP